MSKSENELLVRLQRYIDRHELTMAVLEPLGGGQDGSVWESDRNTAIKVFSREANYWRERDCYLRLHDVGIERLGIFSVPTIIGYDDSLWVVEMDIVTPPYFLDFGKAYLDRRPPFDAEQIAEAMQLAEELFDAADWPDVEEALLDLRLVGIHYLDIKPANIRPAGR